MPKTKTQNMTAPYLTPENTKKLLEWLDRLEVNWQTQNLVTSIKCKVESLLTESTQGERKDFGFKEIQEIDFIEMSDAEQLDNYNEAICYIEFLETKLMLAPPPSEARSKEEYALDNLLNDIEEFLCHLEDFTHGRDGDTVTELRYRIRNYNKQKKK